MSTFEYVRTHYRVPARRGLRVVGDGKPGVITGADGAHILIRLDGEKLSLPWHPTWHMRYIGATGATIWHQPCEPGAPCGSGALCTREFWTAVTIPDAGTYNDEDAYNVDTEKLDPRKIKVTCPGCSREFAALCSPNTVNIDDGGDGMRWVGCDHREPYQTSRTRCGKCGTEFRFTTYTPQ